jgi:vitamin B12 transporter
MPKWQFIEALTSGSATTGFEEQQIKNIPGVTTTTTGNPGQLTTISIQGSASKYTKILWSGLSISETQIDGAIIPFTTGKVEVVKGVHCAEYGSGAIGGVVNVIPFVMPNEQNGGLKLDAGNYARSGHLWWRQKTKDGFSLQQHIEGDVFHGKNSIPKRYQTKYPTAKGPETEKRYFLNQLSFDSHHVKASLQIGLIKLASTGNNIKPDPLVTPYDSRSKRTLQIYALDLEGAHENVQPFLKILKTKLQSQDFSPYQSTNSTYGPDNIKVKIGTRIKKAKLTFEPLVEHHHNAWNSSTEKQKKNDEYAFAQGIHLNDETLQWRNWVRMQKAKHYKQVYAASTSLLKTFGNTEVSAHLGSGFQIPDLYQVYSKRHGNSNLKSESAYGGNIGIAKKTSAGTFSLLVFKTKHKDQIGYQPITGKYININARKEGFEIGWKNRFGPWGVELSGMCVDSVSLKPKKTLMNIPKVTANGQVFYTKDDIITSVGWRYTGSQTQPDFETSSPVNRGGYPVFFGDFQYKFKEHATWYVAIENALARKIESPHGYRNPGFQINTGISITW